jgi:GTP-binding protein
MKITQASFLMSNSTYQQCPKADKPEYAFIGRSNVGKSSLINSIVRKKNLAKTSQTPGKHNLSITFLSMKTGIWSICQDMAMLK